MADHTVESDSESKSQIKEKNFQTEFNERESLDKDLSPTSSADNTLYGGITARLNIPKDWPELASEGPLKYYFWTPKSKIDRDLDTVATQPSVFDDPDKAKLFQPIPQYENLHRFDPLARWTWNEEKKIVRKMDLRIMLWCAIMFMALQLDRGNISQAVAGDMLTDLNLSTNVYNNGNTIFKVCFLICEVPSQLVSKKLGPDVWIPIQMISWSIVAFSQHWLNGAASFYITRGLIGAWEGGFIADICLYLSYFYTASELPVRLAYFWAALTCSDIISAFLGFGILHMNGAGGKEGWRWLFLIEGCITCVIGIISFFMMPPSPTKTASWFRGRKGWFDAREETIIVNRVLRDDPSKGDMHNRQALDFRMLKRSLLDYDLWPIYLIGLVFGMSSSPVSTYLTLTLRSIGFTTLQSTLMVLPYQVAHLIILLLTTYAAQRLNERSLIGFAAQFWIVICLIPLRTFTAESSRWAKYAVTTVLLSSPYTHAIQVGWTSRNSNSVRTRTLSAAMYNMFCQLSGIITSYVYRADDKPLYHRGNTVLIGLGCMSMVVYILVKFYYIYRNQYRDKIWNAMTEEEQNHYKLYTTDEGSARLDFRFAH
ncbi:major facilitator superfamily domain-containing protein [Lipomyces oligophaga]|uniref:major facilitator superfamily domain-containing protein n=1 Tax=Lipomyces oligophaga TaxID=45792 RepID=UPI0034CD92B3